jgi:hypothetical protein
VTRFREAGRWSWDHFRTRRFFVTNLLIASVSIPLLCVSCPHIPLCIHTCTYIHHWPCTPPPRCPTSRARAILAQPPRLEAPTFGHPAPPNASLPPPLPSPAPPATSCLLCATYVFDCVGFCFRMLSYPIPPCMSAHADAYGRGEGGGGDVSRWQRHGNVHALSVRLFRPVSVTVMCLFVHEC